MYSEERDKPYTADEVMTLFPVLTEVECLIVSRLEERFLGWHIWPHVDYPKVHIWLAKKNFTAMQLLAVGELGDMPGEIANWINFNSSSVWGTTEGGY